MQEMMHQWTMGVYLASTTRNDATKGPPVKHGVFLPIGHLRCEDLSTQLARLMPRLNAWLISPGSDSAIILNTKPLHPKPLHAQLELLLNSRALRVQQKWSRQTTKEMPTRLGLGAWGLDVRGLMVMQGLHNHLRVHVVRKERAHAAFE